MPKEKFKAGQMLTTDLMDGFVQQTQVLHSRGDSQEDVMSQKAITTELDKILNADDRIIYQDKTGKIRKAEHIPKAATVVVGLAERGYTEDEVDVLIRPSDEVKTKIEEAVEKLGSGGEIKLLEGTYDFNNDMCKVGGDTEKEVRLTGCGSATKLKRVLLHFSGGSASDFSIEPREGSPDVVWFTGRGKKLKLSNLVFPGASLIRYYEDSNDKQLIIDHCDPVGEIYGKNQENWQNIYINGVAEYVALNTMITKTISQLTQRAIIVDGIPNSLFSSDTIIELQYDIFAVGWGYAANIVQFPGENPGVALYGNLAAGSDSINKRELGAILRIEDNALRSHEHGWTTYGDPNEMRFRFTKLTFRRYLK